MGIKVCYFLLAICNVFAIDENSNTVKETPNIAYKCGNPKIPPSKNGKLEIINGQIAVPHSFPWMVSISAHEPGGKWEHKCGGSLIHDGSWVLTAAHCGYDKLHQNDFAVP